jgi:hypothetical protein
MGERGQLVADSGAPPSPKKQGYPDECEESALTSNQTELLENRNYTVELSEASKTGPLRRQVLLVRTGWCGWVGLEKLHLNQDGIKRSRVAQVREFF